jgi:hypothetical protein
MTTWRKSSYSAAQTQCVEVSAVPWRKSSYSAAQTTCVEAGTLPGAVLVRDTKDNGTGLVLSVTPAAWTAFLTTVR